MESLYAWIHVADLAFGREGDAARPMEAFVREQLRRDVSAQLPELGVAPEVIAVTGNVARAGDPAEYLEARAFLVGLAGEAGLGPERLLVVPGAGDLTPQAAEDRRCARLLDELREGRGSLDAALAHPEDRGLLQRRREHYRAFAASLGVAPPAAGDAGADWTHRVEGGRSSTLRFIGLDTALVATGDDRGKLRVSVGALARALPGARGDLVVVLSQHPLNEGWMRADGDAEQLVSMHAHVHLSGSPGGSPALRGRVGRVVHAAAGLRIGADGVERLTYHLAAVLASNDGARHLRVWPRCYSPARQNFMPDMDALSSNRLFNDFPLEVERAPLGDGPPEAGALLETVKARSRMLEGRIDAVVSAKTREQAREALRRLEAESQRYLGGVGDDFRTLQMIGAAPSPAVQEATRALRRRAQLTLARGMLQSLLDEASPSPDEVFRWTSMLVALGTPEDLSLFEEAALRLRFDFLPAHVKGLVDRFAAAR